MQHRSKWAHCRLSPRLHTKSGRNRKASGRSALSLWLRQRPLQRARLLLGSCRATSISHVIKTRIGLNVVFDTEYEMCSKLTQSLLKTEQVNARWLLQYAGPTEHAACSLLFLWLTSTQNQTHCSKSFVRLTSVAVGHSDKTHGLRSSPSWHNVVIGAYKIRDTRHAATIMK